MKLVRVDKNREAEVPVTWIEAEAMITNALGAYYDGRGKNLARLSVAARVAHGMFGKAFMAADPSLRSSIFCKRFASAKAPGSIGTSRRKGGMRHDHFRSRLQHRSPRWHCADQMESGCE
jgi:hypothetical protein